MSGSLTRTAFARLATAVILATLCACGIDQGGARTPVASQEPLVLLGPITGFGSVLVNGITLETASAQILVNGNPAAQSDLREGQIIRAVAAASRTENRAVSIDYQANVRGPIEMLDTGAGALTVLGQNIEVDAQTVFDLATGGSLADLSPAQSVEISGFKTPTGAVRATYIGDADPAAPFEVVTDITVVDVNALTFELGVLQVDYSQVLLLQVPAGIPQVGIVVEVQGLTLGPGGELVAEQVRLLDAEPGLFSTFDTGPANASAPLIDAPESAALQANFIGFITFVNLPTITMGDVQVTINATTILTGGIQDDLQPGRKVQVVGEVLNPGTIEADQIVIF